MDNLNDNTATARMRKITTAFMSRMKVKMNPYWGTSHYMQALMRPKQSSLNQFTRVYSHDIVKNHFIATTNINSL